MTESASTIGELNQDVLCIGCGYNLRGLMPTGRCPECGLSIADSTRGDRLSFADPRWLKRLRFGATLKLWNLLVGMLVGGGTAIIMGLGGPPALVVFLAAIGGLLGLMATISITAQEPRIALIEDPVTLRKVIRFCAVVTFVGMVIQETGGTSRVMTGAVTSPGAVWALLGLIVALTGLIVQIGELKYFRRFALRAPDVQLARSTRILMWGLGVTYGFTMVGGALLALLGPAMTRIVGPTTTTMTSAGATTTLSGGGTPPMGFAVFACFFGIVFLVFAIWYIVLLFRYRRLIHNATMLATGNLVI